MDSDDGVVCQIRAGKCILEGNTARPDLRKGTLRLHRRDCDQVEDTFYVFEDALLERVDECKDGEVYALRFTGNDHKVMYWMQETSLDVIEAFVDTVNTAIGYKAMDTDD
ncbi:hypothetical protein, conserved [Babesia bigemina]|uniref:Pru domain-containing protein n=1 Tax=Babesia bigemina TaxID=5866 RepID=A0A061D8B4_BABBI|nr:hypothetical protein, conserved [Babesia bigemina]CDR96931.1 hypothetical protein, conserved [Babesia bigemina]|eukprot:XP_012769117.1 hypothetical protein, conserved [Babesia bigemina]